ncbi:hypothetical protein HMPREF9207_0020, partial [Cutibacterium acnes J165]
MIAVVSAAVLMLAGLAVLPATVIIVPLLSVGSGALDDNSGGGAGGDACMGTVTGGGVGAGGLTARQKQLVTTIVTVVQRDKLPTQAAVIAIMTAKQE